MNSNIAKRLLFAAWAMPVGWYFVNSPRNLIPLSFARRFFHPETMALYPGQIAAIVLVFMALFEYTRLLGLAFPRNGFWMVYIWLAVQTISFFLQRSLPVSASIFALLMLVALEAGIWGKKTAGRWKRASLLFSGSVFLYIAGVAPNISLISFYYPPFQSFFKQFGHPMLSQLGLTATITSIFLCDTAAYTVGMLIGKHHFTRISPKKTIEGCIGGLSMAILSCTISWHFLARPEYPLIIGIVLGVLVGIFAQVGDLMVSLIKRYFRVKDASDLIPGHGGILDRFDSLFFTAPILGIYFWIISFWIIP